MNANSIVLGILSTWCLSSLLYYWQGFQGLREEAGVYWLNEHGEPDTFWGRQLHCFWCVALWTSVPISLLAYFAPVLLYPLAFAGGTMLLSKGGRIIWRSMTDG